VEEFADVSLLTETFEPVFADYASLSGETAVAVDVFVWFAKVEILFEPWIEGEGDVCGRLL